MYASLLDEEDERGRVFAPDRQPLDEAQDREGDRRADADLLVGRQKSDEKRRHRHGADRKAESSRAPDPITDMAEDEAPDRSHEEPGGENTEAGDERRHAIAGWKELTSDDRGEVAVNGEVVPLHNVAGDPGEDGARLPFATNPMLGVFLGPRH